MFLCTLLKTVYIKNCFYVSSDGAKPIEVRQIHVHNANYTYSDIALFELKEKLDYSLGIMPICLPEEVSGSHGSQP